MSDQTHTYTRELLCARGLPLRRGVRRWQANSVAYGATDAQDCRGLRRAGVRLLLRPLRTVAPPAVTRARLCTLAGGRRKVSGRSCAEILPAAGMDERDAEGALFTVLDAGGIQRHPSRCPSHPGGGRHTAETVAAALCPTAGIVPPPPPPPPYGGGDGGSVPCAGAAAALPGLGPSRDVCAANCDLGSFDEPSRRRGTCGEPQAPFSSLSRADGVGRARCLPTRVGAGGCTRGME